MKMGYLKYLKITSTFFCETLGVSENGWKWGMTPRYGNFERAHFFDEPVSLRFNNKTRVTMGHSTNNKWDIQPAGPGIFSQPQKEIGEVRFFQQHWLKQQHVVIFSQRQSARGGGLNMIFDIWNKRGQSDFTNQPKQRLPWSKHGFCGWLDHPSHNNSRNPHKGYINPSSSQDDHGSKF